MSDKAARIFKYDDERTDNTWHELSPIVSERSYGPTAQEIGEQYGPGTYLLIEDTVYVRETTIVARSTYEEAQEEEQDAA